MSEQRILRSKKPSVKNPCKTVGEYAWKKLQEYDDDFVCVINARTDERLTIGSFKKQTNSIAMALLKRGVTKTDVIAFYGSNTIEHITLRFVAYFLGLTFMPLSPTFERYEVEQEYKSGGVNMIFSSARDLHKFNGIIEANNAKLVVVFDGTHDRFLTFRQLLDEGRGQSLSQIPHFDLDTEKDMLFLIHTSGSTGRPKCAMIPHQYLLLSDQDALRFTDTKKGSVIILIFPLGHIGGANMVPVHIIGGATVVLLGDFDMELFFRAVEKYRVDKLPIFPNIGLKFVEGDLADKYDLSSIQVVSTGGAAFPANIAKAIIDKYGVVFRECYGMTECALATCGLEPGEKFIPNNVGQVVPDLEVKVIDLITGESLGPNTDGEICVRGRKVFRGYLRNGEISLEAFDSDGWYRSGDVAHYDDQERFFITDRLKEVIRVAGQNHFVNISPVEIEQFLLTHKSIAEVAVVGIKNKAGNQWPRAYIVLKEGSIATEQEIQKFVSDTLAHTKQLKGGVVFIDGIHRTAIGKVDRKFYRNLVKDEVID